MTEENNNLPSQNVADSERSGDRRLSSCSLSSVVLQFPPLEKCRVCAGSGLTWVIQRRTKRQQAGSTCTACQGTGRVRNTDPVVVDSPENDKMEQPPLTEKR